MSNREEEEDRELMQACSKGDREAYEILVRRHKEHLVNFFYGMCDDRSLALDLAQEVFIKMYRYRDRYEPSGKFTSYMFTVAKNHWYDHLRKEKRKPDSVSLDKPVGQHEEEGSDLKTFMADQNADEPFEQLEDEQKKEWMHQAVDELPESQRVVVVLSCFEQKPHEEIAEILDIPEGTVKSRKHLAIKKLKDMIEGKQETE